MIEPLPIQTDTSGAKPLVRLSHQAMACIFEVWIAGLDRSQAEQSARAAFDEADRIEQELSRFVEHSDVSRLNRCRRGETVRVGIEAYDCLKLALRTQHDTRGAFDVICSADSAKGSSPTDLAPPVIRLDADDHTVTVLRDDVRIDLGGIGKGYALDRMAEILSEWGVTRGLVHAGQSTVLAIAAFDDDPAWSISLRHPASSGTRPANSNPTEPRAPARANACSETVAPEQASSQRPSRFPLGRVRLGGHALSGSGRLIHGAHIINPRTGQPASGPIAAWASAPSAAEADALSTAFMVMTAAEVETYCGDHPAVAGLLALPPAHAPHILDFGMEW